MYEPRQVLPIFRFSLAHFRTRQTTDCSGSASYLRWLCKSQEAGGVLAADQMGLPRLSTIVGVFLPAGLSNCAVQRIGGGNLTRSRRDFPLSRFDGGSP